MEVMMTVYAQKLHTTSVLTTNKLAHKVTDLWNQRRLSKQLARERKQLARLPAYLLADIGVSASAAKTEAAKQDVPTTRIDYIN